jgi:SAM-dependent methyltransferase
MRDANSSMRSREMEIYRGTAKLSSAQTAANPIVRLCTDWGYARRVVRYLMGLPVPLDTEDRRVLEQVVFSYFLALPRTHRVLFIGCDWYTKHYQRAFFSDRDYWTLDVSPKARRFGGTQHIVDGVERLERHFAAGSVDLIFCNGVYGFGLDRPDPCERAIEACWSSLRPGGYFVFGWDDIPARTPVPLDAIAALNLFERFPVAAPGLGSWHHLTATPYRHTYDFYRKAALDGEAPT